ncbi:MAG: MotA/TolQ/ExbB proton channel family protein [Kiritimatiellia bacterium]
MKLIHLIPLFLTALPAFAQEAPPTGEETMLSLILKGGYVMIPLGAASFLALAITFERFFGLRKKKLIPPEFLPTLKNTVDSDERTLDAAVRYCESLKTPVANIFRSGLVNLDRGLDAAEKAIEDAGAREMYKLKRSLRGLSVIASVAPLLGLLGTVYGMISAFQAASTAGMGKADTLANGIYEALVTTAAGLTIAVPVLLIYQMFLSRVDGIVDDIDEMGIDFLQHLAKRTSGIPSEPLDGNLT